MRAAWAAAILLFCGCSSGSSGGSRVTPDEAGADAPEPLDAAPEARADAAPDAQGDVPGEVGDAPGEPTDASVPDEGTAFDSPSPFEACAATPPGDGGSRCVLYTYAVDGAIADEAGEPTGLAVSEDCTVGQPCSACLGDALFSGVCE